MYVFRFYCGRLTIDSSLYRMHLCTVRLIGNFSSCRVAAVLERPSMFATIQYPWALQDHDEHNETDARRDNVLVTQIPDRTNHTCRSWVS